MSILSKLLSNDFWLNIRLTAVSFMSAVFGKTIPLLWMVALFFVLLKERLSRWYIALSDNANVSRVLTDYRSKSGQIPVKMRSSGFTNVIGNYFGLLLTAILVFLVLFYCSTVPLFLRYKDKLFAKPQHLFGNASRSQLFLVTGTLTGLLALTLYLNWDDHYPKNELLAIQETYNISAYVEEPAVESFANALSPGIDKEVHPVQADDPQVTSTLQQTDKLDHVDSQQAEATLDALLLSIRRFAGSGMGSTEAQVATEVAFLNFMDQSPHMLTSILDSYEDFPAGRSKDHLRALLATSGNTAIESHAIAQITSDEVANKTDWLDLLRDAGVHTAQGREIMLDQLQNFSEPGDLSNTLLAIAPQILDASEKQEVIDQLAPYLNHSNDMVRNAAVTSFSRWADSGQSYVLEQALADSSETVRQAAVSAAFTSVIKSETIKSMLLNIMRNENENWSIRIDAHDALSSYTLQGSEHDEFYLFHLKQTENINTDEARG